MQINVTAPQAPADPCAAASEHWKSAESIGTIEAYQDHVTRFGGCAFAGLAKVRIESLKGKAAATNAAPTAAAPKLTPPLIASAENFSAEAVPFITTKTRTALANEYAPAGPNKAMALNITGFTAYVVDQPDQAAAGRAVRDHP